MIYTLGLKGLPFEPHPKQIIYVENTYDEQVNEFIQHNYDSICSHFAENGYEFVYLPLLSLRFDKDVRSYYNPSCSISKNIPIKSSFILDFMAHPENRGNIKPSLLYVKEGLKCKEGEDLVLRAITMDSYLFADSEYDRYLRDIVNDIQKVERVAEESYSINRDADGGDSQFPFGRSWEKKSVLDDFLPNKGDEIKTPKAEEGVSYSLNRDVDPASPHVRRSCSYECFHDIGPDDTFDEDTKKLVTEIEERINKLQQKGISRYILENLFRAPIKPSRMVITADFRILLPDYNNEEIEMTPLVKAVYILFLVHPEGIPFKHLGDYREELMDIYCDVCGGWLTDKMERSVEAVTDPYNNSINEKCARIREAFIKKFEESIAEPYIIQGKRGEPKYIALPPEMVEWQTK